MIQHKLFPFEYDAWDPVGDIEDLEYGYYDVIITDTFGSLGKGQEFDFVSVNYLAGELDVWDKEETDPIITVRFGVIAL